MSLYHTTPPARNYAAEINELQQGACEWCGEPVVRGKTITGKRSWFDAGVDDSGGHLNHWVTCRERKRAKTGLGKKPQRGLGI